MPDRGAHELAQLTERLLKSRHRAKRQWLVERIGRLWAPPRGHSCFKLEQRQARVHALPTAESIEALSSFRADPNINVRIAVAAAICAPTVPAHFTASIVSELLSDSHPFVRASTARHLNSSEVTALLEDDVVDRLLDDTVYSVRWEAAAAVRRTRHADRGWRVLRHSIPRTNPYLPAWLQCCTRYRDQYHADEELKATVATRLECMDPTDFHRQLCRDILAVL